MVISVGWRSWTVKYEGEDKGYTHTHTHTESFRSGRSVQRGVLSAKFRLEEQGFAPRSGRILFAIKKPDGLVPASDIPQILTAKSRRWRAGERVQGINSGVREISSSPLFPSPPLFFSPARTQRTRLLGFDSTG